MCCPWEVPEAPHCRAALQPVEAQVHRCVGNKSSDCVVHWMASQHQALPGASSVSRQCSSLIISSSLSCWYELFWSSSCRGINASVRCSVPCSKTRFAAVHTRVIHRGLCLILPRHITFTQRVSPHSKEPLTQAGTCNLES